MTTTIAEVTLRSPSHGFGIVGFGAGPSRSDAITAAENEAWRQVPNASALPNRWTVYGIATWQTDAVALRCPHCGADQPLGSLIRDVWSCGECCRVYRAQERA